MSSNLWNYEAGRHHFSNDLFKELYINSKIGNFLEIGNAEKNFFLVGPKGSGKTLFLNFKSFLYRNTEEFAGYKFSPALELCENIMIENDLFSKDDVLKYENLEIWEKIWLFTLLLLACKAFEIKIPDPIDKLIQHATKASTIITNMLLERNKLYLFFEKIPSLLLLLEKINSGVAIFIDNTDHAFMSFLKDYPNRNYESGKNPPSVNLWINAQLGLVVSIFKITRHNKHIKIYTTVRSEAFRAISDEMRLQYESYATKLQYDKGEIQAIFEKNIGMMKNTELVKPGGSNLIENFLGFNVMPHPFACDLGGKQKKEYAFDFIYRHTFGRPREIVYLGNKLFNEIQSEEYRKLKKKDKISKIRWLVNSLSHELFVDYTKEIIPKFDVSELDAFLQKMHCNVIPIDIINVEEKNLINHYYCIGLIGITVQKGYTESSKFLKQKFLPVSEYSYVNEIKLPKTNYYLTHPAMDNTLKEIFSIGFYNKANIIGNEYDFYDSPDGYIVYDIVLSYASEQKMYVEEVANHLLHQGVRVYYDEHQKDKWWTTELDKHLTKVYSRLGRFCLIFISKEYSEKFWTNIELKVAQERSSKENASYIWPVTFDGHTLPGLSPKITPIDLSSETPKTLANLIIKKLAAQKV